MAVKLRLRREGTKKKPHYRVVAADSRAPRDGRFIEILGDYHPLDDPSTVRIDHDRALYWLGVGAQPSLQVKKLLRIQGIWQEFKPDDEPTRVRPDAPPVPNIAPVPGDAASTGDTDEPDDIAETDDPDGTDDTAEEVVVAEATEPRAEQADGTDAADDDAVSTDDDTEVSA